jgi:hypothetical protein
LQLRALSAGSRALPGPRFAGVVHSVFRRACNLRVAPDGRLLTLLPAQAPDLPQGVRLDVAGTFAFLDHLAVGQTVACRAGVLRFAGTGLAVDLGRARPWRLAVGVPPADLGRPRAAAAWATAWRRLRQAVGREAGDAGLLAEAVACRGLELAAATRRLCAAAAELAVARLVGLGPGLTPAGDDLLVGWLAGLRSTAGADPARRGFLRQLAALVRRAAAATGDISRSQLEAAADGEFAEPIARLARAIAAGAGADAIERATATALRVGHSSGADGVRGLLLGMAAWSPAPSPSPLLRRLQRALDSTSSGRRAGAAPSTIARARGYASPSAQAEGQVVGAVLPPSPPLRHLTLRSSGRVTSHGISGLHVIAPGWSGRHG